MVLSTSLTPSSYRPKKALRSKLAQTTKLPPWRLEEQVLVMTQSVIAST
jgi:hypothetical protein